MTDARAAAAERLRVRAERLRAIRRRVIATALATFVLAFGVIATTGAMGTAHTKVASTGGASRTARPFDDTTRQHQTQRESPAPAPMTTHQS